MAIVEQMHIIDNKKVMMTVDEYRLYEEICTAYNDPPAVVGKQLFQNLFESNEQGMIQFLRPPTNTCTYEVIYFMQSLMLQQHLREAAKMVHRMQAGIDASLLAAMNKDAERITALEKRIEALEKR